MNPNVTQKACLALTILWWGCIGNCEVEQRDPLEGVRIGLLHPSGGVVWPVDTVSEKEDWFHPENWRERGQRRRQSMKLSDEEFLRQPQLHRLAGGEVSLTFGGLTIKSEVSDIVRIDAGCGETEPSWYAPSLSFVDLQDVRVAVERAFKRDWKPVLVQLGEPNNLTVQPAEKVSTIPKELLNLLDAEKLATQYAELVRTENSWTVYTDRIQRPARLGAVRTIWENTRQGFELEHTKQTNPTIERRMSRNPYGKFEANIPFYRKFVGRVYARIDVGDRRLFLTKYRGYESDTAVLEELQNYQLKLVRVDGFDRGC